MAVCDCERSHNGIGLAGREYCSAAEAEYLEGYPGCMTVTGFPSMGGPPSTCSVLYGKSWTWGSHGGWLEAPDESFREYHFHPETGALL